MGLDLRMKGDKIPDQNHIARFCRPMQVADRQIQATAFMLRVGEESLSVNWLEFLNCSSRKSEIAELRKIYSSKLKVGSHAKIAVLNVGGVREKVLTESPDRRNLEVLHNPELDDPSHSGIYNLRQDDELIAELILETVHETYPARQYPRE
jgi:hypothetical protein